MKSVFVAGAAFAMLAGSNEPVQAMQKLIIPEGARPLTVEETINIYQGKTIDFKVAKYYFDKNNELAGYSYTPRSFASGTWSVNLNKFCMRAVWRGRRRAKPVKFSSCSRWFFDGSVYWTKIVKSSSRKLAGTVYKGDESMVSAGDLVSGPANKVRAELGYR